VEGMNRIALEWAEMRPFGGFGLIMADPPWTFSAWSEKGEGKNPTQHYECQSLEWVKALPIDALAAENCLLWLWATSPMLPQAIEVMTAWGFTYKTMGFWSKRTKNGKLGFGTGYLLRCAGEPFILATRGKVSPGARNVRSVIDAQIGRHSEKPAAAFDAAARLVPDKPRIEVFSRKTRPGWYSWGNEVGLLDEPA
jgi:N6-adenosine-specific RNA methylase IME4